jgi:hypothetical protein
MEPTLGRSVPEAADGDSKPATAPIGSDPKPAKAPIGSEMLWEPADAASMPLGPGVPGGISAGAVSLEEECGRSAREPYQQVILEKLEQGLSARRIYQDLVGDGFDHEYHSVRRFASAERKRCEGRWPYGEDGHCTGTNCWRKSANLARATTRSGPHGHDRGASRAPGLKTLSFSGL